MLHMVGISCTQTYQMHNMTIAEEKYILWKSRNKLALEWTLTNITRKLGLLRRINNINQKMWSLKTHLVKAYKVMTQGSNNFYLHHYIHWEFYMYMEHLSYYCKSELSCCFYITKEPKNVAHHDACNRPRTHTNSKFDMH